METKHTPGPWTATEEGKVAQVGGGFVPIRTPFRADAFVDGPNRSDHPEEELSANARLIAAAPELLAALVELYERAEHGGNVDGLPEYEQARAGTGGAAGHNPTPGQCPVAGLCPAVTGAAHRCGRGPVAETEGRHPHLWVAVIGD